MIKLINLSDNVIQTLDFFTKNPPPRLDLNQFELPFVVGSSNAYFTGLNLFSGKAAIFANESNFKNLIKAFKKVIDKKLITQSVIISASGEKDSIWQVDLSKKYGLKTTLLTTKSHSSAAKIADKVYVFKSISEPYSYNVSTYMGMMLSATGENPQEIKKLITAIKIPVNFSNYDAYSFILPDKYQQICPMLDQKKSELFGGNLSLRAYSEGHARHAVFIIRSTKELVISLGISNQYFGDPKHRFSINIPKNFNFASIMVVSYYLIGKIQEIKPQYFKQNIISYCHDYGPKAYGREKTFEVIVPGSER